MKNLCQSTCSCQTRVILCERNKARKQLRFFDSPQHISLNKLWTKANSDDCRVGTVVWLSAESPKSKLTASLSDKLLALKRSPVVKRGRGGCGVVVERGLGVAAIYLRLVVSN